MYFSVLINLTILKEISKGGVAFHILSPKEKNLNQEGSTLVPDNQVGMKNYVSLVSL